MRSEEMSIIRLKNQNKPIREKGKPLGVAKSGIWCVIKQKEYWPVKQHQNA